MKEGLLLINKPSGPTSFTLVKQIRRLTGVKKVGHAGTLDPFASGVMILLVGRKYTRLSDKFMQNDKEYLAHIFLGASTDTYDCEGQVLETSANIPSDKSVGQVIEKFQGTIYQEPPMYSAKKVQGKKLYELARQGKTITRTPCPVHLNIRQISYTYPELVLHVHCSKGTYIRSLAHDIGKALACGAHLKALKRLRCGPFNLKQCIEGERLKEKELDLEPFLKEYDFLDKDLLEKEDNPGHAFDYKNKLTFA